MDGLVIELELRKYENKTEKYIFNDFDFGCYNPVFSGSLFDF